MNYNPIKKVIQITPDEAERAVMNLRHAMQYIRKAANLPLDTYKRESGPLSDADFAQKGILDACEALGMDCFDGARWGEQIDLRDRP